MTIDLAAALSRIAGARAKSELVDAIANGITDQGAQFGLDRYSRLAHFIAQVAHESGRFVYNEEIWGPTSAQKGYEGRRDLGNTEPGDGYRFRGRGPIQLTGRANYRSFTTWCRKSGFDAPNFEEVPDKVTEQPWNVLAAIAYWDAFNPTGKSLNRYADANNIEAVTRKINGGLNGFDDRIELYTRTALVFLGYEMEAGVVAAFQRDAGFDPENVDDIAGPRTREALHKALVARGTLAESKHAPLKPQPNGLAAAVLALIAAIFRR